MARALIAIGVAPERAFEVARRIEVSVAGSGRAAADVELVRRTLVETLGPDEGEAKGRQLVRFRALQALDAPLIVLVGGATGTGKSSVATELAYRLGITRVTSTDFVRQTLRAFFSREFMPAIHYSSFEAARAVTDWEDDPDATVHGFVEQTRNVLVGVRAAIDRALTEKWSMVLEGVHLVPGLVEAEIADAVVVQCVLAIDDEQIHGSHFLVRDLASEGSRSGDKYLSHFDEIRQIQRYIVERANRAGVPVIQNRNMEACVGEVMELVLAGAERFAGARA